MERAAGRILRTLAVVPGLIAGAGLARADGLDVRFGIRPHQGQTVIYRSDDTFKGWAGGLEYNRALGRALEAGAEWNWGDWVMHSRDVRGPSRWLDEQALGLTLRLIPTSAKWTVAPYLGAGVDAVFYDRSELDTRTWQDVVPTEKGQGTAFGGHVLAGARLYLGTRGALVAEGRYRWVQADPAPLLARGETGTGLSMSRAQLALGIHVRIGRAPTRRHGAKGSPPPAW